MNMPATHGSFTLRMTHPITGQLIASLRDRIVRIELAPGMRLSEQEIAESYSVSRQPVREAFIRLAGEGLVEVRPQRGTFVRKIFTAEVEVSRFMREAVEAGLVRLAAVRAGDAEAAELRAQIGRQTEEQAMSTSAFMQLDERLHRTIAEMANMGGVWEHLQPIKKHMDRVRYLTAAEFPVSRLIAEHRLIVDAIAARDPDAAEAAIRQHLRGVLKDLPLIAATQPDFFETQPDPSGFDGQIQGREP